jgi:hypothetical protein
LDQAIHAPNIQLTTPVFFPNKVLTQSCTKIFSFTTTLESFARKKQQPTEQ